LDFGFVYFVLEVAFNGFLKSVEREREMVGGGTWERIKEYDINQG